ncbi:MAG: DUF1800 domain-containing protein [Spirosomataceae bacterium]
MPQWNRDTAKHLLARTLFGYTKKDLDTALSYLSLEDFVNKELLADKPLPAPPGDWINEVPVANDPNQGTRYQAFVSWWYNLMLTEKTSMREKLVLFLHNHYTSQRSKVTYPQHMYMQQNLFRKNVFGNLRQLTKDVTIDPAMLIYLDGRQNNKNVPNENYARELMELFTLGIGNYTETDIKQAAKALTGWTVSGLNAQYDSTRFDSTNKTFLGKTGNFGYKEIVDTIFAKNEASQFLCRKLYEEFVFYKADETFVSKMAKVMRDNDYNLRPVLFFMLTSEEFYKPEIRGAKIKSPTELLIGSLKLFGVDTITTTDFGYLSDLGRSLTQQLLEPPNVAGWPGQREWISSNTYPQRGGYTDSLVNGKRLSGATLGFKIKPIDYVRSFNDKVNPQLSEDAVKLVDELSTIYLPYVISDKRKKFLLDNLLDGTTIANWSTNTPMAEARIQKFLKAMLRLPEFQLT